MSFRRDDNPGPFGSRWRIANRGTLIEYGVPALVTESDRRWGYAMLHGDEPDSGWDVSWLSDGQARRLLGWLKPQLESWTGLDLINRLERRSSAGRRTDGTTRG